MCYSEEQSKVSLIINIITCYVLYTHKNSTPTHKILALFFAFVGIMQLFDIIFWRNQNIQHPYEAYINYTTTKIAMFFNHFQPIILAYLIYTFKNTLGHTSKNILPIYSIIILFYTIYTYNNIKYTLIEQIDTRNTITTERVPTLKWEWNIQQNSLFVYLVFLLTLVILFYENFTYPFNIILALINITTFILSAYYYKGKSLGRFWCKFAAWIPLLFIFIRI